MKCLTIQTMEENQIILITKTHVMKCLTIQIMEKNQMILITKTLIKGFTNGKYLYLFHVCCHARALV